MLKISDVLGYIRREAQKKKDGKPKALQRTVVFTMAFSDEGLYTAGTVRHPSWSLLINMMSKLKNIYIEYICEVLFKDKLEKVESCRAVTVLSVDLYFSVQEGLLYFYHISGLQYEMKICTDISEPISTLIFSPDHTTLLIVTDQLCDGLIFLICQGTIYTYEPAHSGEAVKLLDAFSSYLLAADFLSPGDKYCVWYKYLLKEVNGVHSDIDKYVNDQGMLNVSAIKREQYDLEYPLSSAVRLKDNIVYGYCTCAPLICKYHLSKQSILEDPPVILSEKMVPSNQFGAGFICLSPNSRWLASAAKDGILFIYDTSTMEILAQNYCHSYEGGGIKSVVFSLDGKFILVNGENDGVLVCLKWKKIKEIEVKEADFHWQSLLTILNKSISDENAVLRCMAEWQLESESTSESLPEEKSKVFS
ncbi:hypothetical protein CIB84_009566 [Bambusicola thoracicus]|uniref:Uncharacterized protein n=1 Tax=Bambusicola thoracicus TaxID=9083 RepID=A0A2P4SRE2_BAMTH|nr:hypothetical protein CIB84_009566 [Bambusicola thoracicus]